MYFQWEGGGYSDYDVRKGWNNDYLDPLLGEVFPLLWPQLWLMSVGKVIENPPLINGRLHNLTLMVFLSNKIMESPRTGYRVIFFLLSNLNTNIFLGDIKRNLELYNDWWLIMITK